MAIPTNIRFDESYVLELRLEPYRLFLRMDFALGSSHPKYAAPDSDERECFRRGSIEIANFHKATWHASGIRTTHDATGEIDFGRLDEFAVSGEVWQLTGDWGVIELEGGKLSLTIDS